MKRIVSAFMVPAVLLSTVSCGGHAPEKEQTQKWGAYKYFFQYSGENDSTRK